MTIDVLLAAASAGVLASIVTVAVLKSVLPKRLVIPVAIGSVGMRIASTLLYRIMADTRPADVNSYFARGAELAANGAPIALDLSGGTPFIVSLSHMVQAIFWPSRGLLFVAGALLSHLALLAIVVSVSRVGPSQVIAPFAAGILLFPSLIFWTSAFSKDMASILGIALLSLAFSKLRRGSRVSVSSAVALTSGALLLWGVRPQILLLLGFALALTLLSNASQSGVAVPVYSMLPRVFAVVALLSLGITSPVFLPDAERDGFAAVVEEADATIERTRIGESNIRGIAENNYPLRVMTVWSRPLPWEAHGVTQWVSAAESVAMTLTVLWFVQRWKVLLALAKKCSVTRYALVATGGWSLVLATFSNVGLMVRIRALSVPFALFVAVVLYAELREHSRHESRV